MLPPSESLQIENDEPRVGIILNARQEYKHILGGIVLPYLETVVASEIADEAVTQRTEEIRTFLRDARVTPHDSERSFELTPDEAQVAYEGLTRYDPGMPHDVMKRRVGLALEMQLIRGKLELEHYTKVQQKSYEATLISILSKSQQTPESIVVLESPPVQAEAALAS